MAKRSLSKEEKSSCDAGGCLGFSTGERRDDGSQHHDSQQNNNPNVDLVEQWNQLSIEERTQVYEDLHGVASPIVETPERLQHSLAEMQIQLDKQRSKGAGRRLVGRSTSGSYELALRTTKGRSYAENPKFRLVFLRCERFDAEKAATRYLSYFDLVHYLFGEELLCRDVTMDDLGPKEIKELRKGHIQFLSQRDSAGRAVQFLNPIGLMEIYSQDDENEKIHVRGCCCCESSFV
jgi:hypothetical protein